MPSAIETATNERSRLSATDWEQAALQLIADEGISALAIDALARRLGVTKGSFYWHFRSRDALLFAALERWQHHGEDTLLTQITAIGEPRERLRQLFLRVAGEKLSHRVHAALLNAMEQPRVRAAVELAARRRLDILTDAYRQTGLAEADALNSARLAYAAYVGFLQLGRMHDVERLSHDEMSAYVDHVIQALIPE
ncbi:MAG: TetR/AcrR family transcriptional regulator [Xanthomonadales bacterium]|nr:TetR/AcrR family transcriptional regulator [Xanthomonadales bacterium]